MTCLRRGVLAAGAGVAGSAVASELFLEAACAGIGGAVVAQRGAAELQGSV